MKINRRHLRKLILKEIKNLNESMIGGGIDTAYNAIEYVLNNSMDKTKAGYHLGRIYGLFKQGGRNANQMFLEAAQIVGSDPLIGGDPQDYYEKFNRVYSKIMSGEELDIYDVTGAPRSGYSYSPENI